MFFHTKYRIQNTEYRIQNTEYSLLESYHWLDLLYKRDKIGSKEYQELSSLLHKLHLKLNNYIKVTKSQLP